MATRLTPHLRAILPGSECEAPPGAAAEPGQHVDAVTSADLRGSLETLLLELTSQFARITPERMQSALEEALQQLMRLLQVERAWIAEFAASDGQLHVAGSASSRPDAALPPGESISARAPWYASELREGHAIIFPSVRDGLLQRAGAGHEGWLHGGLRSTVGIPINVGGKIAGAIGFCSADLVSPWSADLIASARTIGEVLMHALVRIASETRLVHAIAEIKALRERTEEVGVLLQPAARAGSVLDRLMSHSACFRAVLDELRQVAVTDSTVLLTGETGTGKELLTHAIHELSPRHDRPMVTVNCAALTSTLIEAELFGREKGAYTGALTRQQGRFEMADGSTIFLDEIGELPLELQAKLLRVLQEGEFERVGGTKTIKANVRVIAATNHDLAQAVNEGTFRDDLYYRLNVFPIAVPPLRERREDILMLAWSFIKEFNQSMGRHIESMEASSVDALQRYSWPGNIRELRNTIERAMILTRDKTLRIAVGGPSSARRAAPAEARDSERSHIIKTLEACRWRIRGPDGAAAVLNVKPTTLESRMKRLGIARAPQRMFP